MYSVYQCSSGNMFVIAVCTDVPGWCCVRYADGMSEKIIGKYMEERKNLDKVMMIVF